MQVEHLVIFSTLNQITNYIAIKALKPTHIYNITFSEGLIKQLKLGIDPKEWDDSLKKVLENDKELEISDENIRNIEIQEGMYVNLDRFNKKIKEEDKHGVLEEIQYKVGNKDTPIYWHITGGQRVFMLPIYDVVKERPNDMLFYLEANTEEVICYSGNGEEEDFKEEFQYEIEDLDFNKSFQLMGYELSKDKRTEIIRLTEELDDDKKKKISFYNTLYGWMIKDGASEIFEIPTVNNQSEKGTFRELLILSNNKKFQGENQKEKEKGKCTRQDFLRELFKQVREKCLALNDYDIEHSEEMKEQCPAGYIFEKIVAYKIFELVKDEEKVLEIGMSLKTKSDEKENTDKKCIDELDIAILTNTGRIINFECKSGSMSGDNAKSHHFTTYALSGVFGAPIFMTPLLSSDTEKDTFEKLKSADRAAKRAKLKTIYLNEIDQIAELL